MMASVVMFIIQLKDLRKKEQENNRKRERESRHASAFLP